MARLRTFTALASSMILAASVAGCGPGAGASASPSAVPSMLPSSGPSPTPTPAQAAAYTLDVVPEMLIGRTLPKSRVVFLVTVSGSPSAGPVEITVEAADSTTLVEPAQLSPGTVGEVTVIPDEFDAEQKALQVTIAADRAGVRQTETRTLDVVQVGDDLRADADLHLAPFLTWLAANRPDLGIGPDTEWEGTAGSWVLIVSHYLYFSTEWELDLEWHVMIPPDDWSRIYLRKRGSEVAPSLAFEIGSVAGKTDPKEITPPEAVWR